METQFFKISSKAERTPVFENIHQGEMCPVQVLKTGISSAIQYTIASRLAIETSKEKLIWEI